MNNYKKKYLKPAVLSVMMLERGVLTASAGEGELWDSDKDWIFLD